MLYVAAVRSFRGSIGVALMALTLVCGVSAAAAAAPSQRITFYFGLTRPEAAARAAFFAVQQPGSSTYRRFLTVNQVARYGASASTRSSFLRAIRRLGFSAGVDRSGVFARVSGSVARFDRVFHVRVRSQFNNDVIATGYFLAGNGRLRLPPDLRGLVRDVVPSFTRTSGFPRTTSSVLARPAAKSPRNTGTWTRGCRSARALGTYSFGQVRHAYGIDKLGGGGGASVAILNVGEGLTGQDIAENASCFGYPALHSRTLLTDAQRHPFGHGSFEPEEDLALVRGMAPGLRSLTFTQAWPAAELWFLGAAQVLSAPDLPDAFSISYGECERDIRGTSSTPTTRAGADLLDSLLVRLGLVGVGSFASSGDFGSTCDGRPFLGVTWPGSSPYLTAVGGTRLVLNKANQRTQEVVWNDLKWFPASQGGGVSGGGISSVSPRPPFQAGLGLPGRDRAVPDVSAQASNFPGWPVVLAGNWVVDGGTSASTPLIASAFAILSHNQRAAHRPPLGPVDGLLYWLHQQAPATLFDVVSGSNGYAPHIPDYHARRGYDLASGLGVPRFDRLAAALPAP